MPYIDAADYIALAVFEDRKGNRSKAISILGEMLAKANDLDALAETLYSLNSDTSNSKGEVTPQSEDAGEYGVDDEDGGEAGMISDDPTDTESEEATVSAMRKKAGKSQTASFDRLDETALSLIASANRLSLGGKSSISDEILASLK